MIHTVKGFSVVTEDEVEDFLEFSCFFNDPMDVGNLISGSSAFSKICLFFSWLPGLLSKQMNFCPPEWDEDNETIFTFPLRYGLHPCRGQEELGQSYRGFVCR